MLLNILLIYFRLKFKLLINTIDIIGQNCTYIEEVI